MTFADAASLEGWLGEHGATSPGARLRFAKKGAIEATDSKSDAIDCALAHGWVDGKLGQVDEHFFKARFRRGACQRQFLGLGWIHNNLRMYWAKRITAMTPDPETGWATACYLK